MANLSDILMGFRPQKIDLVTEHSDLEGHSALVETGTSTRLQVEVDPNGIISVGPNYYAEGAKQNWWWTKGKNHWKTYNYDGSTIWRQTLNVNRSTIMKYGNWLNELERTNRLLYSVGISSCVTHTSIALNLSGIFNIGIHPFLLNAEMYLWNCGIRPWSYSYLLKL
jgi:hypothetical protein